MTTCTSAITGNFMQELATQKGPIQFSFLRQLKENQSKYFILAMDPQLKPYWFAMESCGANWRIVDRYKVPDWIFNIEKTLAAAIAKQLIS